MEMIPQSGIAYKLFIVRPARQMLQPPVPVLERVRLLRVALISNLLWPLPSYSAEPEILKFNRIRLWRAGQSGEAWSLV